MATLHERLERGRRQWGDRFDPSALMAAPELHRYYDSDQRVEVDLYGDGSDIQRGRISTTTGWRPAFLLMRRRNDSGSIYLLDKRARVLRVISS